MSFVFDHYREMYEKSNVNAGDLQRIFKVFKKAEEQKEITVGVIGGSITQGASAGSQEKCYGMLIAKWWEQRFPDAKVNFINAGIGATGSYIGVHRVKKDLLIHNPDFVVVEYAVNDSSHDENLIENSYEGTLRRILSSESKPGIMLLFMINNQGLSMEKVHTRIGLHYNLPMVSYGASVWSEIGKGALNWTDISPDIVHPNEKGHYLAAKLITDRLDEILNLYKSQSVLSDYHIPLPLTRNEFENGKILTSNDIEPEICSGWEKGNTHVFSPGWVTHTRNAVIEFDIDAANIGLIYRKYNSGKMGRAAVKVDDREPVILEAHFPCYWGGPAWGQPIALNLGNGKHKLQIKFLDEHSEGSTGEEFMVCALLTA